MVTRKKAAETPVVPRPRTARKATTQTPAQRAAAKKATERKTATARKTLVKRISVEELPSVLKAIIAEHVQGDIARITVVSHTEIIIHNNPVE